MNIQTSFKGVGVKPRHQKAVEELHSRLLDLHDFARLMAFVHVQDVDHEVKSTLTTLADHMEKETGELTAIAESLELGGIG